MNHKEAGGHAMSADLSKSAAAGAAAETVEGSPECRPEAGRLARRLVPWFVFATAVLVPVMLMLYLKGGPRGLAGFLRGQRLLIETLEIDLGRIKPGESRQATVGFQNVSGGRVTVLGAEASCRCGAPQGPFPVVFDAFERRDVPIVVAVPSNASGEWRTYLRFITDVAEEQPLCEVHGYSDERSQP
jgi:hypothetical protein